MYVALPRLFKTIVNLGQKTEADFVLNGVDFIRKHGGILDEMELYLSQWVSDFNMDGTRVEASQLRALFSLIEEPVWATLEERCNNGESFNLDLFFSGIICSRTLPLEYIVQKCREEEVIFVREIDLTLLEWLVDFKNSIKQKVNIYVNFGETSFSAGWRYPS